MTGMMFVYLINRRRTINYLSLIRPGLKFFADLQSGPFKGSYIAKVVKCSMHKEIIIPFIFDQTHPLSHLVNRLHIKASFYHDNRIDGIYTFETCVKRVDYGINRYLVLDFPQDIRKIQRRRFYRVSVNPYIGLDYYKLSSLENMQGLIMDVSGGGILIKTPSLLGVNEKVLSRFKLDDHRMKFKTRIARSESLRNDLNLYGLEFLDMSSTERNQLIEFVCRVQRDKLKYCSIK